MQKITRVGELSDLPKIALIKHGALVTGVPGGKTSIYRKVQKRCAAKGVTINWTKDHCVLMNIEYGTLREIPGDTQVQPVICENMEIANVPANAWYSKGIMK